MPIYFEATDSTWDLLKGEEKGQNVYSGSMLYVASEENFPLVVHNNILLSAVAGGRLHKHHQALHDRVHLIFEYQNSAFAWINSKSKVLFMEGYNGNTFIYEFCALCVLENRLFLVIHNTQNL